MFMNNNKKRQGTGESWFLIIQGTIGEKNHDGRFQWVGNTTLTIPQLPLANSHRTLPEYTEYNLEDAIQRPYKPISKHDSHIAFYNVVIA